MRRHRRGMALISFALALTVLVPLLGLAADSAMLYIVRERLNAAVQLSARAAVRSAKPEEAVNRYFSANFPEGFLGVRQRTIHYQAGRLHASVEAPTYFMQVLRITTVRVEAESAMDLSSAVTAVNTSPSK